MKKRSSWFVKHPIQAKYLVIVAMAMLAPTLLIGFCLYHLVFYLLANQMVFPEAIQANLAPVVDRVNRMLLVALPILLALFVALAINISHRFGGPIERLERELDQILEGDHQHRIQTRPGDDWRGVANRINALIKKLTHSGR